MSCRSALLIDLAYPGQPLATARAVLTDIPGNVVKTTNTLSVQAAQVAIKYGEQKLLSRRSLKPTTTTPFALALRSTLGKTFWQKLDLKSYTTVEKTLSDARRLTSCPPCWPDISSRLLGVDKKSLGKWG